MPTAAGLAKAQGTVVVAESLVPPPAIAVASNSAFTDAAASPIFNVQATDPAQAPDQPTKREPAAGEAVRVTPLSSGRRAAQVAPQSIPAG